METCTGTKNDGTKCNFKSHGYCRKCEKPFCHMHIEPLDHVPGSKPIIGPEGQKTGLADENGHKCPKYDQTECRSEPYNPPNRRAHDPAYWCGTHKSHWHIMGLKFKCRKACGVDEREETLKKTFEENQGQ